SDGNGGTDTQTVTVTVDAVNDAPVAQAGTASGDEDTVISGRVAASDVDGDTLTFALATDGANGAVTMAADGSYSYTPDGDFNGSDSFTYTVSDGNGGTDAQTVTIT
ncbi:Ig-like domain-containing protein, partial [Neptunicoccus sediminis]|uniref:Ig-like domain-containing protein n=1 Tax=Neptunicoccus sediminis TaxID=1892596 RepID=UPI000AD6CBF0